MSGLWQRRADIEQGQKGHGRRLAALPFLLAARPVAYRPHGNRHRASPWRRAASLLLAIGIEVLLLLAFFTLNWRDQVQPRFEGGRLTTFDVAAAEREQERSSPSQQDRSMVPPPKQRPVPPAPKPEIALPERPLDLLIVTREVYQASDISRLGSNAPAYVKGSSGAAGQGGGDSQRVGTAPDGAPLYAAEWYREPTNQELSAYLPKTMPEGGGWGLIACRTAERYRVTDCVELGNSPPGSHLAGAVRRAAWQFLVRPPRVGGKPMIGEWVQIRIDYSQEPARP